MADAITIKALQDASLDAKSLEEVVNGDEAKQVTTRKGESYPSVKKAIKTLFENGGLPATPFATKALMTASALVDGDYAIVTNDAVNNGLYIKETGVWGRSEYDPATQDKGYTNSKVAELSDIIDKKLSIYLRIDKELLNVKIIDGETTSVGDLPTRDNAAYERTDYIPVKEGDVINFKGAASSATPIKLFDADKGFLRDVTPTGSSREYFDVDITVDADTKFIIATSAVRPSAGSYTIYAPLEVAPKNDIISKLTDVSIPVSFNTYNGFNVDFGNKEMRASEYYQISERVPVSVGDTYLITGSSNPDRPIKGYDIDGKFVIDWPVNSNGSRAPFEYLLEIPEGIAYIVAASYYKLEPDSGYDQPSPLRINLLGTNPEFTINRIVELQSDLRKANQKLSAIEQYIPALKEGALRSMSYNIYKGGRDDTGRELILKHINRVVPDILTVTEAGNIEILKPLLEDIGFRYFYGVGGTYELFFASKKPIIYTETVSAVDYTRKPLYAEVQTDNGVIGVLSIHLASGCASPTGLCHDEDYRNVEPWEPRAQQRTIQMYQIMDFLNKRKALNPELKGFIMQGDYNQAHDEKNLIEYNSPITESYLPEGLSYPLPNAQFPEKQYEYYTGDMRIITSPSANGLDYTWWGSDKSPNPTNPNYPIRLDYISYSDDIELVDSEILNSESDSVMPHAGIQKYGKPLSESDSYTASDHTAVVADFIIK